MRVGVLCVWERVQRESRGRVRRYSSSTGSQRTRIRVRTDPTGRVLGAVRAAEAKTAKRLSRLSLKFSVVVFPC